MLPFLRECPDHGLEFFLSPEASSIRIAGGKGLFTHQDFLESKDQESGASPPSYYYHRTLFFAISHSSFRRLS